LLATTANPSRALRRARELRRVYPGDIALTDELIDSIFAANVRGPFATIRAFAPLMKKAAGAVIVNISSIAAIVGTGSNIA
jgi:NAD(P)-dependent dehydrogenase (short-subunit alcohol dehydrogenase family)